MTNRYKALNEELRTLCSINGKCITFYSCISFLFLPSVTVCHYEHLSQEVLHFYDQSPIGGPLVVSSSTTFV